MGIIMWGWPLSLSSVLDPVHFFVKCLVVFLFRVPPWCMMMANLVSILPEGYLGDMITQGASYVALRERAAAEKKAAETNQDNSVEGFWPYYVTACMAETRCKSILMYCGGLGTLALGALAVSGSSP